MAECGEYARLVDRARAADVHVELVAGKILRRDSRSGGKGGQVLESRAIVELRLTHTSGRVWAKEPMYGLRDRNRAAAALLGLLEG